MDIRNFNIFDESQDKKKFIFRLQTKPNNISSINTTNDSSNLEDAQVEKMTSSGSSSCTDQQQQQQHTEILFKTKSLNEMRRIFGLLQWKNSLIFEDSVSLNFLLFYISVNINFIT